MKQESKISRIFQAFTEEPDLTEDIIQYRREICETCPFNSKNAKDENLSLLQRQKKAISPDFCLKCGCFIEKKIARSSEACGMEEVGLEPKWNRILLRTASSTDINFKNHSFKQTNLKISDMRDSYELDVYNFKKLTEPIVLEVLDEDLDKVTLTAYCECLTVEPMEGNKFSISIDLSKQTPGTTVIKTIEIKYSRNNKNYNSKILIKGKYEL